MVKIVGMSRIIDMKRFMVQPEDHGVVEQKTLKQLILEYMHYIRENGREYKNLVRKMQRSNKGDG